MGSTPARRPGTARLLALCAVLLGLFLMHGAPATAADGCHGAVGAAASVHEGHEGHEVQAFPKVSDRALLPHADGAQAHAVKGMSSHGTMCVAIPAQNDIPVPVAPLVGVAALAVLAAWALRWAWNPDGTRRRGPPGGRGLLLQVCIART
ncbi:hypothetical protein [Streptomyces sp. NPDC007905]|uniref:hypothetical protein n=1 Tax=Streptomyces sp. NPDC007905 TaxID=3364788 RepID=UPI0036EF701E